MDRLTANRYISLQQKIASSGGGVPQEIIDEVEALDATVNGDETQDPPVVGLVDIVGDLENSVEDLDTTVNGDSTTEPPTPGLVSRVSEIEDSLSGATLFNIISHQVNELTINTQWGDVFYSDVEVTVPAALTVSGVPLFAVYVASDNNYASVISIIPNDTTHKVVVSLGRSTSGTVSGNIYIAVANT